MKFLGKKSCLRESLELMQNRMEALIVALEVFCFKGELSIEDFVSLVTNMYNTADKLGVPLDRLTAHITELKDRIDAASAFSNLYIICNMLA